MKNWHAVAGIVVAGGATYFGWRWYQAQKAKAMATSAPVGGRAPIEGVLPGPQGSGQPTVKSTGLKNLVPGVTMLGRPDIAARREAGAQAAASLRGVTSNALASAQRSVVAAGNFVASLGDSTQTSKAAKNKAVDMAIQAHQDGAAEAAQAKAFVDGVGSNVKNTASAVDNFGGRVIRGL